MSAAASQPLPVVCAIIERNGRVLVAQRASGKHLALKWEFPGGKVEPGEEPSAALKCEIREELGCEIEIVSALPRSMHRYDRVTIEMIPYVCRLSSGSAEPQPHEHAAIEWVRPQKLDQIDLAPADLPVVASFRSRMQESGDRIQ